MKTVLHLIKTKAYTNDSRLLKWIKGLSDGGITSSVFVLQDDNQMKEWDDNATHVTAISLFFRKFFRKRKGYLFKIPEFTFKSIRYILHNDADILVFHDMQHYLTLLYFSLFGIKKKIIWDLHELPHQALVKLQITRWLIRFILNRVDMLVYTNKERRNYILQKFRHREKEYSILNNYPDKSLFEGCRTNIPIELEKWLGGEDYVIWLGNGLKNRNFLSFIEAIKKQEAKIKVVVLGKIPPIEKDYVVNIKMDKRIFDTFVEPKEMKYYIDNALFSVVLYKDTSPNNWLCEPNRLYQLTSRNVPVITGNNPPLRNFVTLFNAGIVLPDDGSDSESLSNAIKQMLCNCSEYKLNLEKSNMEKTISWENQFKNILKKLSKLCK